MKKLIIPKQTVAKEDIDTQVDNIDQTVNTEVVPTVDTPPVDEITYDDDLVNSVEPVEEGVETCGDDSLVASLEALEESIVSEIAENDKVSDIAENLSDIADTVEASPNEQLSDTEKQLIASSANMAVAGTDEDAEVVAPSLESFADKALIIAELRKKHQIANEGIADSLQGIVTKFSEFVQGMFSFASKIEYKIRDAKKAVAALKVTKQKEVEILFKKSTYLKKSADAHVESYQEYNDVLEKTVDFFGKFTPLAIKSVADFKNSVREYWLTIPGSEKTFEAAAGLYNAYVKDFVNQVKTLPGMEKSNSMVSHSDVYISEPLLGGAHVSLKVYKDVAEAKEDNIMEMKNTISNSVVFFDRWFELGGVNKNTSNKVTFKATVADLEKTIKLAEQALKVFKVFLNEAYKSFKTSALLQGPKIEWNGKLMSLHTLIVNRGINNSLMFVSYAREYSKILCSTPMDVVNKIASSTKWERE